ncbi:MAG: carboxylesterase/lipase family protein [Aquabacterium sp.]|nr:carboxylesterase/lipase family protein [Aquabacterium sp.]
MLTILTALGCWLSACAPAPAPASPPVAQTSFGAVSGKSYSGVRAYLGIPYAAAPVGDLRWQIPQAPRPWSGVRRGDQAGSACMQPASLSSSNANINEDCLYVNVFAPEDIGTSKLPVMVWIHGGGFVTGSASDFEMANLARDGRVIVVSLNYRLGAFGFFRHPDGVSQGVAANLGLLDQQAALRWVKSQVGAFGGDAGNVTIFGESAGAASVCMHLVSPYSAGLFHKAISQSGACALNEPKSTGALTKPSAEQLTASSLDLGGRLGCASGADQLSCMRSKSADDVLRASNTTTDFMTKGFIWSPVQDGVSIVGRATEQLRQGQFNRVPVLLGSMRDEGRLFVAAEYHLPHLLPVRPFELADVLVKEAGSDALMRSKLFDAYSWWRHGSLDKALAAMYTDSIYSCPVMADAQDLARHVPTYHYEFSEPRTPGIIDPYMPLGAFHGADLRYLFQAKLPFSMLDLPLTAAQQKLAGDVTKYWARFAYQGDPNVAGLAPWPRFQANGGRSLVLQSGQYKVQDIGLFQRDHHCDLWPQN